MRTQVILLLVVAASITVAAADDGSPAVKVTRLGETLHQLTTDQGAYTTNSLASVGADGLLLVDTQSRKDGEAFRKAVEAFGKGAPTIIINTHRHGEHVGGNELFGEAPIVIAHPLVRSKLRSGSYLFDEFPDATLPDITFTDSLSVHFNGEEIRLIAMPGSHDDNEIIVHFTKSKVVHLSSLAIGDKLLARELFEPAVRFLEASLAEYPGSSYAYYANYELAVAHDRLGHREAAIRYCRTAAEQNPDSPRIAAFLQELESRPSPTS